MQKKLFDFFEIICYSVDFFKSPFTFYFSKDNRFISSKFGTFISIIIIIYLINEIFNSNMYQKTNPAVITQNKYSNIRPRIELNNTNFEFSAGLFSANLTNFKIDPSFYDVKIYQNSRRFIMDQNFTKVENISWIRTNFTYHECKNSDYNLTKGVSIYPHMVCLDNDINWQLEGYVNEYFLSYFIIEIGFCNNKTFNGACKSPTEIENDLKGKFFGVYFSDWNIMYQDFSHPLFNTPQAEYFQLDKDYFKQTNIFLKKFEFYDDSSSYGSNPTKHEGFSKDLTTTDFSRRESDMLGQIYFFSSQALQQNTRRYQKITEVFATIGGSASLLISIGFIFVNISLTWNLRVNFLKNLYDMQIPLTKNKQIAVDIDKSIGISISEKRFIRTEERKQKEETEQKNCLTNKIETKAIKEDSFILENYSKGDLNQEEVATKKTEISFFHHVKFKIKQALGFKLSKSDMIYKILDNGFKNNITGNFLFKKMQEFDCLKKTMLDSKEIALFNMIEKPKLYIDADKLLLNLENESFGLFPIVAFDERKKKFNVDLLLSENKEDTMKKNERIIWTIRTLKEKKEEKQIEKIIRNKLL